jgi:hypothetical protein
LLVDTTRPAAAGFGARAVEISMAAICRRSQLASQLFSDEPLLTFMMQVLLYRSVCAFLQSFSSCGSGWSE